AFRLSYFNFLQQSFFFFFNDPATTEIYTLSLHDALPISREPDRRAIDRTDVVQAPHHRVALRLDDAETGGLQQPREFRNRVRDRSEEHTSELQSRGHLVCRLLLEKKKKINPCNVEI